MFLIVPNPTFCKVKSFGNHPVISFHNYTKLKHPPRFPNMNVKYSVTIFGLMLASIRYMCFTVFSLASFVRIHLLTEAENVKACSPVVIYLNTRASRTGIISCYLNHWTRTFIFAIKIFLDVSACRGQAWLN